MAARCGLPYDGEARTITMDLLGEQFLVSHPDYTIVGPSPLTNAERILFLRYLLDGRKAQPLGQFLTFRDFPLGGGLSPAVYRAVHQTVCFLLRK